MSSSNNNYPKRNIIRKRDDTGFISFIENIDKKRLRKYQKEEEPVQEEPTYQQQLAVLNNRRKSSNYDSDSEN